MVLLNNGTHVIASLVIRGSHTFHSSKLRHAHSAQPWLKEWMVLLPFRTEISKLPLVATV